MKRRTGNIDTGKPPRRPLKSRPSKFADGVFGSSFIYLKYVIIWFLILIVDFILEFRFEYMWPFWLLLQAVYDTFKCQGLAYSVFFVCIAITSDTICLLFIPIQWLFFMASTYVWIHYVWHTDKGICLPTVVMWIFFMYIEATMRQHDLKHYNEHIGLCKPFAAHCIGHPVVTLGVGIKTYISYRIRLRTQKCVQKENQFYYEILKQSLPKPVHTNSTLAITEKERSDSSTANGSVPSLTNSGGSKKEKSKATFHDKESMQIAESCTSSTTQHTSSRSTVTSSSTSSRGAVTSSSTSSRSKSSHTVTSSTRNGSTSSVPTSQCGEGKRRHKNRDNSSSHDTSSSSPSATTRKSSTSSPKSSGKHHKLQASSNSGGGDSKVANGHVVSDTPTPTNKIELVCTANVIEQLEATILKLRGELKVAVKSSDDGKAKVESLSSIERSLRSEISQLMKENESLQTKQQSLFSGKLKDKQKVENMEKRLKMEAENRSSAEKLLQEEKRKRKEEEESASRAAAAQTSKDKECYDKLRKSNADLEGELSKLHKDLEKKDEKLKQLQKDISELQQQEKSSKESGTLMSALEAMQEKNLMLENSLSAETKLKLDLFSALGDVKRQLEIAHAAIYKRDSEITGLKQKMTEFLSVMPNQRFRPSTPHYSTNFLEKASIVRLNTSQPEFSSPPPPTFSPCPRVTSAEHPIRPVSHPSGDPNMMIHPIPLDPNAIIYNPNTSM